MPINYPTEASETAFPADFSDKLYGDITADAKFTNGSTYNHTSTRKLEIKDSMLG